MNQKKMTIHFLYWFFLFRKQRKQIIILRNEKRHQLAIKHTENVKKKFSTITSELGSNHS